jgi:multicomponent Na+:H+ antiporter subunit E
MGTGCRYEKLSAISHQLSAKNGEGQVSNLPLPYSQDSRCFPLLADRRSLTAECSFMIHHFFLNLSLAFIWCLLQNEISLQQFIIGYLVGAGIMRFFLRVFHEELYFRKVGLGLRLLGFFLKELLVANWAVTKQVLSPRLTVRAGIIAYPLELQNDLLITLLANMITLTPGTLSVEVAPDRRFLFIHVLDIADIAEEKRKIKDGFERYLQRLAQ